MQRDSGCYSAPVDVTRWKRIQPVFEAAVGLAPDERDVFLVAACEDEDLRQEVQELLEADGHAGEFLEEPAARVPDPDELTRSTLPPGMVLSQRFRLVEFLAAGGMGEVYEARDLELGVDVALKIVHPETARDADMMERFRREVHLARQVTHPSVCRIHEMFHHPGPLDGQSGTSPGTSCRERSLTFFTMELIRGETLARWLTSKGPLTTAQALPIIQQIVDALTAAHERGIIHRDLKASNVMLDSSRPALRVVVMDFGLARPPSAGEDVWITRPGQVLGTPACMAPEQRMGGGISPATDIYALGILMCQMLTGHAPCEAENTRAQALEPAAAPAPPRRHLPDLDPRWERVILRCLEHLPGARFASAREVLASLRELAPRPHVRRWRQAAAVLGSVALAGVFIWTLVLAAPLRPALTHVPPEVTPGALGFVQRWLQEIQLVTEARAYETAHAWEEAAACYRVLTELRPDRVDHHLGLATGLTRAGHADQALAVLDALRARPATAASEPRVAVDIDLVEAETAEAAADYRRSLRAATQAVQRSLRLDDRLRGHARYREARAHWRLGDLDQALAGAQIAAALYQKGGDPISWAGALALQANVLESQAQTDQARALYEQALTIYRDAGHQAGILEVLINLAIVVAEKERNRALAMLEEAAGIAAAIGDRDGEARALHNQAWIHKNQGAYDVALMLYKQALALAREIGNESLQSAALSSQASILRMQGKLEKAATKYIEALSLARQIGDREGMSSRLNNLGVTLRLQGDLRRALRYFDEARALADALGDERRVAQRLTNMGTILRMQGKLAEAQGKLNQALTVHERITDPEGRAFTLRSLGLLWLARGELVEARTALNDALAVGNLAEAAETLLAQRALAALALEEGDLDAAEVLVQQVIDERTALAHRDEALDGWLLLARIHLGRARVARAQAAMREAEPLAKLSQDLERRLRTRLVAAEIAAAAGERSLAAATLAAVDKEADGADMVELRLEIQLASAALTMAKSPARGRDALRALADEAEGLGFRVVARRALSLTDSRANSRLP
jgi:tetratricopeptide (TPR) repeat protein